jgi:hypothetical protein
MAGAEPSIFPALAAELLLMVGSLMLGLPIFDMASSSMPWMVSTPAHVETGVTRTLTMAGIVLLLLAAGVMQWRRPTITGFALSTAYGLAASVGWTGLFFVRFAFSADIRTGVAYGVIGVVLIAGAIWCTRSLRRAIARMA